MTKINAKQLLLVFFWGISALVKGQMVDPNSKAFKNTYNVLMKMMQPGSTVTSSKLNSAYQGLYKEAEKETERYFNSLKELNYNYFYNQAENLLKKEEYINALNSYNIALSYIENGTVLNSKGVDLFRLGDYKLALECFNKSLKYNPNDSMVIHNENITKSKLELVQKFPFHITDIKIGNVDFNGNIKAEFGKIIYSENTLYLKPRIFYSATKIGKAILNVKIYDNAGKLSKSNESEDDFSFTDEIYFTTSSKQVDLKGWGNKIEGAWGNGNYRFEIWSGDLCLAIKEIYLPSITSSTNTFIVPFYSTQSNFKTSNSNIKSKTCGYCNGTGTDPYPSYVPSYGNDRTSNNRCEICGKFEIHYHKRCTSCGGKGFIESYY